MRRQVLDDRLGGNCFEGASFVLRLDAIEEGSALHSISNRFGKIHDRQSKYSGYRFNF
jgi:hypothetical protein